MSLRAHYQNAYVTHDIEKAKDLLSRQYGLSDYIGFEMELPVRTPEGEKTLGVKVACAWAGWLQIELIEPVSGAVEPYLPYLPADRSDATPRFHHISLRRDNYDEMQAEIARLGLPSLVVTLAGLIGLWKATGALPVSLPLWLAAVAVGAVLGTQFGLKWLPLRGLRYALAAVLLIAAGKLLLA